MLWHCDRSAHRDRNRVANSALVGTFEAFEQFVHELPRACEDHLGVLRHPEYAIAVARDDHLGRGGGHGLDHDLGAIEPAAGGALDSATARVKRGVDQAHDLRAVRIDRADVRYKARARKRSYTDIVVGAGLKAPGPSLEPRGRLFVLAVHPGRRVAAKVLIIGSAKSECDSREWTDNILLAHRDSPSVTARHSDRLADNPMLSKIAAWDSEAIGNGLSRLEHPDRKGKRVRSDVAVYCLVQGLELRGGSFVHKTILALQVTQRRRPRKTSGLGTHPLDDWAPSGAVPAACQFQSGR